MKDFFVLSPDQTITGKLFLEAAAGCGKTFAIEHLVIRLVIEREIPIDKFLIVTFTKAAASDLKKRIGATLLAIEEGLMQGSTHDLKLAYLERIADRQKALRLVQRAIEGLNGAMIATIHSFCKRFLMREAFELDLILQPEETSGLAEKILDCIRTLDPSKLPTVLIEKLKQSQQSLEESLKELVMHHLGDDFIEEDPKDFDAILSQALTEIKKFQESQFGKEDALLEEIFPYFSGFFTQSKQMKYPDEAKLLKEGLFDLEPTALSFEKILLAGKVFLSLQPDNLLKKSLKNEAVMARLNRFFDLIEPLKQLVAIALNPSFIAKMLIVHVQKQLQEYLYRHPLSHPDYLLKKMVQVVRDDAIKERLKAAYPVVLIDEFQDTDPIQWQLFETVFFNSPQQVLFACVGDPKQSIYGFRNADVAIYLKAKQQFPPDSLYVLRTNYRADERLIQALNQVFSDEGGFSFFNFSTNGQRIDYFGLMAKHAKLWDPHDEKESLCWLDCLALEKNQQEEALFEAVAREYQRLIAVIEPLEIVFLVKDRIQGQKLKSFLEKKGIKTPPMKTDLFAMSAAYTFGTYLLDFFFQPHETSFKRLLLHPFLRGQNACSRAFIRHDWKQLFSQLEGNLSSQRNYSGLIHDLNALFSLLNPFENLLSKKKFQDYEDLTLLMEWLMSQGGAINSLADLIRAYGRLKDSFNDEQQPMIKRSFASGNMAQIMTIHASKGLEFDVVFALGLYPPHHDDPLFYKQEMEGVKKWAAIAPKDLKLHESLQAMEKMRLFYVAATRARKRVYIPLLFIKNEKTVFARMSPMELFLKKKLAQTTCVETIMAASQQNFDIQDCLRSIPFSSYEPIVADVLKTPDEEHVSSLKEVIPPHPRRNQIDREECVSFSALARTENSPHRDGNHPLMMGAEFGTLIHELIEKTIESRLYDQTDTPQFKQWLAQMLRWLPYQAVADEIEAMIHTLMTYPLIKKTIAIKDLPYQALMPEMKLEVKLDAKTRLVGFIDLMIFYDGDTYLFDFKTHYLGSSAEDFRVEALEKAVETHDLTLQAACYAYALENFIERTNPSSFAKAFQGVTFVFLRGLKFQQGVLTLNDPHQFSEKLDVALLSRA